MRLPPLAQLRPDDFPSLMKATGGEADKLFRAVNGAITSLVAALSHALTFGDNMLAAWRTLTFTSATLPTFAPGIAVKPAEVSIAQAWIVDPTNGNTTPVSIGNPAWTTNKDGQIVISSLGTLDAAKRYRVTFRVVGG